MKPMTDIVKFELVKKYLERHPNEVRQNAIVIDVGGIPQYFHLLESLFRPALVFVLNLEIDMKSVPSILATANHLPFKDETCNVITSFDVLEHLLQPEKFVSEASRVLQADGLFVLATPNLADIYSRVTFLFGYTPFHYDPSPCRGGLTKTKETKRGHKSVFTYGAVRELLKYYRFEIVESYGYPYIEPFYHEAGLKDVQREVGFNRLRRALGHVLPPSLSEGMILFCKKNRG